MAFLYSGFRRSAQLSGTVLTSLVLTRKRHAQRVNGEPAAIGLAQRLGKLVEIHRLEAIDDAGLRSVQSADAAK